MVYKYIKWYHWIWIWILPDKTTTDVDKRGIKILTTTIVYKEFQGVMYIVNTSYKKHKRGRK